MSKHFVDQALALVQDQITKRLNSVIGRLPAAARLLKDLAAAGDRVVKSIEPNKELTDTFHMSVVDVLDELRAIRSGYSTNGQTVSLDEQANSAVESLQKALDVFGERFEKAVKAESDIEALGSLRVLREMLTKALNWEGAGAATPAIHKDPFQTDKTSEQESAVALQTAASGDRPVLTDPGSTSAPTPPQGSIMAIAAQNAGVAPVLKSDEGEIQWPRDMARKGFHSGRDPRFAAAAAAVEKANEPTFEEWPLDMGHKARRR